MDPEVKKELDLKLVRGEITLDEYESIVRKLSLSDRISTGGTVVSTDKTRQSFHVLTLEPGRIIRDRFKVVRLLGRGGMGVVYLAEDMEYGDLRALKILPVELAQDETLLNFLKQEARNAMELRHENIVAVYHFDRDGDLVFLVMEYIDGLTYRQLLLENKGPLPAVQVLSDMRKICHALAYSHEKGFLHRDIKPANLMRTNSGQPKICDLGLSRKISSELSRRTGTQMAGTPLYMPPEQLTGQSLTTASDVYSLGMAMIELLSGAHPWEESGDVAHLVLNSLPRPVSNVAEPVNRLIQSMVAKAPQLRISMTDAAEMIDQILSSGIELQVTSPSAAGDAVTQPFGRGIASSHIEMQSRPSQVAPSPLPDPQSWTPQQSNPSRPLFPAQSAYDAASTPAPQAPTTPAPAKLGWIKWAAGGLVIAAVIAVLFFTMRPKNPLPEFKVDHSAVPRVSGASRNVSFLAEASASSSLSGRLDGSPENVLDGDRSTAWFEDKGGLGNGEWLEFHFKRTVQITRIDILHGYVGSSSPSWKDYPRVLGIRLEWKDGSHYAELKDAAEIQQIFLPQPVNLSGPEHIRLTIEKVAPGNGPQDTGISEIKFWGIPWDDQPGGPPMPSGKKQPIDGPPPPGPGMGGPPGP